MKDEEKPSQAWGITALVTSIASIILIFAPYFGLPLAIVAVVAGSKQKKIEPNGMGVAGTVIGIIGIILNAIMALILLLAISIVGMM